MLKSIKKFSDVFGVASWFSSGGGAQEDAKTDQEEKQAAPVTKAKKGKRARQLTFQEEAYIMTLITTENQTELAPAIKPIFDQNKELEVMGNLLLFIRNREAEIEKICQANFSGFIRSVDDLFAVRQGIEELKKSIVSLNDEIQQTGTTLSTRTSELVESRVVIRNVSAVIEAITTCLYTLSLAHKVREYIETKRFYPAIKILDQIQTIHLPNVVQYEFGKFLQRKIPLMKQSIKKRVLTDVSTWLLMIRNASGEVGRFSMAQTNATIEKKEELNALRTKDVKEYTDIVITRRNRGASTAPAKQMINTDSKNDTKATSSRTNDALPKDLKVSHTHSLHTTGGATLLSNGSDITEVSVFEVVDLNFAPLYQCSYIHEVLGEKEEFQKYYKESRKLQANIILQQPVAGSFMQSVTHTVQSTWSLQSDDHVRGMRTSSSSSSLASLGRMDVPNQVTIPIYASYLNAIAGFFIIEATVLQTSNELIHTTDVTALWDMASNKMRAVLQVEVAYCEDIDVLPELKNYLLVFCRTLRKYGYNLNMMQDFVKTSLRDRYVNVRLDRLTATVTKLLDQAEACEPLNIKTDKEYQDKIVANDLQKLFKDSKRRQFPFSIVVPNVIALAKQFTNELHRFCSNLPDMEGVVVHGLEQLLKIVTTALQLRDYNQDPTILNLGMNFINSFWLQQALSILEDHLLSLGLGGTFQAKLDAMPFSDTSRMLEEMLYDMNTRVIDAQFEGFLKTCQPQSGKLQTGPRMHVQVIFKEINETFPKLKDLPGHAFESMYKREFNLLVDRMMGLLLTDRLRYFDLTYVKCLDQDLIFMEDAARKAPVTVLDDSFLELRQIVNLLMQPEQKIFFDPAARSTQYNKISNTKKLAAVLKKFKEAGGFGPFSAAKSKRKAVKQVMAQLM